jgi:hypothetical protein
MKRFILQTLYDFADWLKKLPVPRRQASTGLTLCACCALLLYLFCINWIEPTQIGLAKNIFTKRVWVLNGGIHFGAPWVLVSRIDTRPIRVSVNSAGRGVSSKLVQFEPKYWQEFINIEGWRYYWWANRLSFNFGYHEEHRGWKDIMRGYAYSVKKYPFITVLEEYSSLEQYE